MDFADIYKQWTSSHDEDKALKKRLAGSERQGVEFVSINAIRRMKVQDELDLHGVRFEDAVSTAVSFVEDCYARGLLKIRIITGKGLHSPGGRSIIRPEIINSVRFHHCVRECVLNPKVEDGGSGAVILILKSKQKESK